ncbi:hypothetical protein, partial [Bacillus pseudomycoides]|uniref:hypothetical protein n=1 Tax=Bacillus pseudomycoides TaxID=64104 RepID=UPI001C556978
MLPVVEALPAGAVSCRLHGCPSYQKASCTEPFAPIHHISMLFGILDTAAIFLLLVEEGRLGAGLVEALPAGAISCRLHGCPSYQKALCTEPFAPIH